MEPSQSPCRGKEVPELLSKDRKKVTILQQKNLSATSEENLKHRTSVAPTSRQTLEGPIPFAATTASLHQTSHPCTCGVKAVGEGEPEHGALYFLLAPLSSMAPTKTAIRPTHLDWLLQDSTANRTDKVFVNIPLETGYIIPHVSSLKPRSWKEREEKKKA